MTALLRYRLALLARSQRWVPPLLLYGAVLGIGVQTGQPVLDSVGYAAAALLPSTAWLVRVCAGQEPPAARAVAVAARGARRVHLATLLAAAVAAAVLGLCGTVVVALVSAPENTDRTVAVGRFAACGAGLLGAAACLLTGLAVGALCNRPVVRGRGRSATATPAVAVLALVTTGSPARHAVTALVSGSRTGHVPYPVPAVLAAVLVAACAAALASHAATRRT